MMFELNERQIKKIIQFKKQQDKLMSPWHKDLIEGVYSYQFTPTGIGIGVRVVNTMTDEMIDVSDYESW
jgi:asparagine synthetase A